MATSSGVRKSSRFGLACGSGAGSLSGSGTTVSSANSSELIVHDFEKGPGVDSLETRVMKSARSTM